MALLNSGKYRFPGLGISYFVGRTTNCSANDNAGLGVIKVRPSTPPFHGSPGAAQKFGHEFDY